MTDRRATLLDADSDTVATYLRDLADAVEAREADITELDVGASGDCGGGGGSGVVAEEFRIVYMRAYDAPAASDALAYNRPGGEGVSNGD